MNGYTGTATQVGSGSLSGVVLPPPQPDCIGTHMSELDSAIGVLGEEIGSLRSCIGPVLKPSQSGNAKETSVPTPIRSNVANSIVNQIEAVRVLIRGVREMRDLVDL